MLKFPIDDLLDEEQCYGFLVELLHPEEGLRCPEGHELPDGQAPHKKPEGRAPVVSYRCHQCGAVFNVFTGTVLSGIRHDCSTIVMILRGFAQGVPTQHLADELGLDYSMLLEWRHRLQESALDTHLPGKLSDPEAEADELFQNAGEKGAGRPEREDSPRRRANKKRGPERSKTTARPPRGVVGRCCGEIRPGRLPRHPADNHRAGDEREAGPRRSALYR
jgi:transposase-like protein